MSMPSAGSATMRVDPAEVVRLKTRLEAVRDDVRMFATDNRDALRGAPFADDDVSRDAAGDFADNAALALDTTRQFIDQLDLTIEALQRAADTYRLTDDTHSAAMRRLDRGV
ncbi:MAG: PE domain-containing protein [Umezawaea sp.]